MRYPRRHRCWTTPLLLGLLTFTLMPGRAQAWGGKGHRVVAAIAQHHLTDAARARIAALLGEASLVDAATWADRIKHEPGYRHTAVWHYLNVPDDADRVTLDQSPPEGSVLSALLDQMRVLRERGGHIAERRDALRFVLHLVGDIHQPLHVSRSADRGGNDIAIVYHGQTTDLHHLWDGVLIDADRPGWRAYAERLIQRTTPEQARQWSGITPAAWATESYRLAIDVAYRVPEDGRVADGSPYADRALRVIDHRLQMAGVRLAAVLNRLFDADPDAAAGG